MMKTFYFTYGQTDTQPFRGGWTEVKAKNREEAVKKFCKKHPLKSNTINCAFIYDEEEFKLTTMYKEGNFGIFCQEIIE